MAGPGEAPVVVVVDGDDSTRRTMARVLRGHGYRVETFTSARDYLAAGDTLRHDCLIADVRLPDLDGISMYEASRAAGHDVPAVFVSGGADVPMAVAAMRAGARDVLEKPVMIPLLLAAIEAAAIQSSDTRDGDRALAARWAAIATLTPREAEVCALAATGRLNKQIAAAIGTTEKTVKVHRARALQKLGVHSIAELVHILDMVLSSSGRRAPLDEDGHPLPRSRALDTLARIFGEAERFHR
jgi:FixJ family two-component response regulator